MKSTELSVLEDVEKMRKEIMKTVIAKEFDEKLDDSEDISEYLDFYNAVRLKDVKRLKTEAKKVITAPTNILNI